VHIFVASFVLHLFYGSDGCGGMLVCGVGSFG